jgi:hypothetical protein
MSYLNETNGLGPIHLEVIFNFILIYRAIFEIQTFYKGFSVLTEPKPN